MGEITETKGNLFDAPDGAALIRMLPCPRPDKNTGLTRTKTRATPKVHGERESLEAFETEYVISHSELS